MKSIGRHQKAFTIPELVVVMLITGFFVTLIMTFMFGYWRYGYMLESDLDTLTTRLNAGDILRDYIGQASGLVNQTSIVDPNVSNPDTSLAQALYWTPLHAVPGNKTASNTETTPLLYIRRFSQSSDGTTIMNGDQPYEDEYVLYIDGATKRLIMRTLANPQALNNKQKTSCPEQLSSSTCPPDKTIAADISSVDLRYFSRAGNPIDYTSIWDPIINEYIGPDFPTVEVVELTINLSKKPVFQQTESTKNSTIIRIALRNS